MEKEIVKPKQLRSFVWKHFGFCKKGDCLDKTVAVCCLCKCRVKYNGNTTNLSTHLDRRHGISNNNKPGESTAAVAAQEDGTDQNGVVGLFTQKLDHKSPRAQRITAKIAKYICRDLRPYQVVENAGFRELIEELEPRYEMPSRPHFSEKCIPALYENVKSNIQATLSQADRVAITTDGWTSCANQSYVTITSHFIDSRWEMKNFVLQTRVLHEAHTGINIGNLLRDACTEWKIADKSPALVTDNARNMIVAGQKAEFFPQVLCFAHTLNLASQKGFSVNAAARLLGKVRKIVGYFHRSPRACHVLQEKQTILDLPRHKLIHDVVTRWNSSYSMFERFLEQQPAIVAAFMSKDLRKGVDIALLTDKEVADVEDIVKLMEPIKMATTLMCEEAQPVISLIAPLWAKLLKHLQPCEVDSTLVTEIKKVMAADFSTRYRGIEETLNLGNIC